MSGACCSSLAMISIALVLACGVISLGTNSLFTATFDGKTKDQQKLEFGLIRYCLQKSNVDDCKITLQESRFTDEAWFLAMVSVHCAGVLFILIAELTWIHFLCTKSTSSCSKWMTVFFVLFSSAAFITSAILFWKKYDSLVPTITNIGGSTASLTLSWSYWVLVGGAGCSVLAFIFVLVAGARSKGTHV